MKMRILLGALVVSLGFCSQSQAAGLLQRMLGLNCGCCQPTCCETSCCEAEASCCEAEASCCEAEASCCEQDSCCDPCNSCNRRRIDLFAGLKGLFGCGCNSCCDSGCDNGCGEASCCEAEASCCEQDSCCDPCNSGCRRGGILRNLFKSRSCCKSSCCEADSCCGGGAAESHEEPAKADEAAPGEAPKDEKVSHRVRRHVAKSSRT